MYEFKTRPYKHQREALRQCLGKENFALLMEMGTGKTKVVIDEIGILWDKGKIDTAVILAPKGVYANWVRNELPTHLGVDADVEMWVSGAGKQRQRELDGHLLPRPQLRILVMNIEALSSGTKARDYLRKFCESGRYYIAVDESTTIKNPGSNRSKQVCKAGVDASYRRIMTGSPVTRSPLDLYAQFSFLSNRILGFKSFFAFRARYAVMQRKTFGGRKVDVVVGHRNVGELSEKIEPHSFRVKKRDCLDLPEKVYTVRDVELTEAQQRAYNQMRQEAFAELETGIVTAGNAIGVLLRLHQICCGHFTDIDGDTQLVQSNRINEMMEVVAETDSDVIIWARYRKDIELIVEALSSTYGPESVAQFHGGNTKTREDDAHRFINNPECRFMVSNQQSGGYGNTWINATTVIYYSNDYDLEKRVQSEDRAHRSGQKNEVTYVDLVSPGTVDERILKALRDKRVISAQVLAEELDQWL